MIRILKELLKRSKQSEPLKAVGVILFTGHGDVKGAVEAMREGAFEHQAIRKYGSVFPVEARAKSLPIDGRTLRVTAARDNGIGFDMKYYKRLLCVFQH